jgi:RNA polymerase sigma factor (sigma-70 family)
MASRAEELGADELLVARFLEGDVVALGQIWKRYAPLVRSGLLRMLGRSPDSPDLEQEVFLTLLEKLCSLREPRALAAFISGVSIRVAHNYLRRKKVRSIVGLTANLNWIAAPSADEETRDVVRRLVRLLDNLDARDRSLFVSRYVEQRGVAEIARSHRLTFATTRRRIGRVARLVAIRAKRDAVLADRFASFGRRC